MDCSHIFLPSFLAHHLGCGSPVSYRFVYAISADICGEADRGGGLARQQREYKTYRKSTAQPITAHLIHKDTPHSFQSPSLVTSSVPPSVRRTCSGGELRIDRPDRRSLVHFPAIFSFLLRARMNHRCALIEDDKVRMARAISEPPFCFLRSLVPDC